MVSMITHLGPRIVIVGNSGSGKSTLAKLLAARAGVGTDCVDLDCVHWQHGVGSKRDEDEARAIVAAGAAKPNWII